MTDDYKRCDTCIHRGCLGDCKYYNYEFKEETNGAQ